jgi:hypothetical protein
MNLVYKCERVGPTIDNLHLVQSSYRIYLSFLRGFYNIGIKGALMRMASSTFLMGKAKAVGSPRAERGWAVGDPLPPHPGLLPRGEGTRIVAGVEIESASH